MGCNIENIFDALERKAYKDSNPFVACLVDQRTHKILDYGFDHHWISPVMHCETEVIHRVAKRNFETGFSDGKIDFSKWTLFTTAEPCLMCQAAITWSGIIDVCYGASRGFLVSKGMDFFTLTACDLAMGAPSYRGNVAQVEKERCERVFTDLLTIHLSRSDDGKIK